MSQHRNASNGKKSLGLYTISVHKQPNLSLTKLQESGNPFQFAGPLRQTTSVRKTLIAHGVRCEKNEGDKIQAVKKVYVKSPISCQPHKIPLAKRSFCLCQPDRSASQIPHPWGISVRNQNFPRSVASLDSQGGQDSTKSLWVLGSKSAYLIPQYP